MCSRQSCITVGIVLVLCSSKAGLAQVAQIGQPAPSQSFVYRTLGERKLQLAPHYPAGWTQHDQRVAVLLFSGNHKARTKDNTLKPLASEQNPVPVRNPGPGNGHVELADSFADRGFVCFRVEYRSRGNDGVLLGEDLKDAFAAIRWVRTHAALLGVDPHRVIACGCSSGGYLASGLFAFEPSPYGQEDPSVSARPDAIILCSPLVDWLRTGSMQSLFMEVLNGDEQLGARTSPARHWRPGQPPTLVIVGTEEPQFASVKEFAETWIAKGEPMELYLGQGGPHGFFGKGDWVKKVATRIDEFFRHVGYLDGPAKGAAVPAIREKPASAVYKDIDGRKLRLSMHYPPDWPQAEQRPAILFFSGGGFNPNDRDDAPQSRSNKADTPDPNNVAFHGGFRPIAEYFAKLGLVTIEVDYRKRRNDGVLPDKAVEDAKSAMRWVRGHASQLGIDPHRIVSCGGSSGGHLAAAVATLDEFNAATDDLSVSEKPNAMVLHFPLLDFLAGGTRTTPFLNALNGDRDLGERLSPARHWRTDLPPTLVLIGTKDPMFDALTAFVAKWKAVGGKIDIYVGEGGGHGFSTKPNFMAASTERMDRFLQSIGYLDGDPKIQLPGANP